MYFFFCWTKYTDYMEDRTDLILFGSSIHLKLIGNAIISGYLFIYVLPCSKKNLRQLKKKIM